MPEAPINVEMIVPSAYNFLNKCTIISFKGLYEEILYNLSKNIASLLVSKNKHGRGKYSILILACLLLKTVEILLLTLVFKEGLGPSWARNVVRWALLGAG